MKKPQELPMHRFLPEDDLGQRQIRYVPLEARNGYDFSEPHRHNYYEVFFFRKGGGTHLIDFVEYDVSDNSVHVITPGQAHLLHRSPGSHGAVVHFSKEVLPHLGGTGLLMQQLQVHVINHIDGDYNLIATVLQLLEAELVQSGKAKEATMACMCLLLLKSLFARTDTSSGTESTSMKYVTAFRKLAEEHHRNGNQPAWYAAQLNITERRLNAACREVTGNTVSNYLKERLILEAKRLLSHSSASIKEIGYYLGFDDPAYFTRFFRKNTGTTAGDFRNSYK